MKRLALIVALLCTLVGCVREIVVVEDRHSSRSCNLQPYEHEADVCTIYDDGVCCEWYTWDGCYETWCKWYSECGWEYNYMECW